ncbi:hypothetical protein [Ferrimonas gelatinilytica]|uniref:Cellulose biosynthesis protein BcsF n=1 Tax=Ferrimonas gelatinilytica TaxID=1255257 RepID=A0ABP9RZI7_9GAMM
MIEAFLLALLAIPVVRLVRPGARLLWAFTAAPRLPQRRVRQDD